MMIQVGVMCHKPYDNPLLERCLDSLVRVPAGVGYSLVTQFSEGTYAQNWNRLMDKFTAEFVCVLEDDAAVLRPNWLRSLLDTAITNKDAAIVMPINAIDDFNPDPGFRKWMDRTARVNTIFGFCNLLRRSVGIRADENLTYFNDIDFAVQARDKGWRCYVNGHVMVLHEKKGVPGRLGSEEALADERVKAIKERDWQYLKSKWDGKVEVRRE